jgi:hypothetical protein
MWQVIVVLLVKKPLPFSVFYSVFIGLYFAAKKKMACVDEIWFFGLIVATSQLKVDG